MSKRAEFPLMAEPEPYSDHELWGGFTFGPDEPIEIAYQRMRETARQLSLKLPKWQQSAYTATEEHLIHTVHSWGGGGEYVMRTFPPIEIEAYCARLTCNWGVVIRGDDCEARAKRAIEEHIGKEWTG